MPQINAGFVIGEEAQWYFWRPVMSKLRCNQTDLTETWAWVAQNAEQTVLHVATGTQLSQTWKHGQFQAAEQSNMGVTCLYV